MTMIIIHLKKQKSKSEKFNVPPISNAFDFLYLFLFLYKLRVLFNSTKLCIYTVYGFDRPVGVTGI